MWRSALESGRQTAVGLSLFALADLIIPGEPIWSAKFFALLGGFNFIRDLSVRRHGVFGSSFLLISGSVFTGAGLLASAGSAVLRESGLAIIGAFATVVGLASLVGGLHARKRDRERATNLGDDAPVSGAISLHELRRRLEGMRAQYQRANRWVTAGIFGFLGSAVAGLWALEYFNASDGLAMAGFAGFWAVVLSTMAWSSKRVRQDADTFALTCPACARPLLQALGNQRLLKLLEELGRCPQCGARIAHEDPA